MNEGILKKISKIGQYIFLDKNPDRIKRISRKNIIGSIVESTVFTVLIILVCYALPFTRNNFLALNMHPLAVMVAIISLRYGIYPGFLSAFIATIGYIAVYVASGNDMVLFFLKFQYHKFFIMFLFIAMILGKFQADKKENEEVSKRNIKKLKKLLIEEREKSEKLLTINRDLKNQIIQSRGGVISFQNIRKNLKSLMTIEEVFTRTIYYMNQLMNCENASIYLVENGMLNQIIKVGNSPMKKRLDLKNGESERFLMAINSREALEFPVDLKGEKPVFVSPVFYGEKIIALFEITRLSYETSKSENFGLFKAIMEEINISLSRIFYKNREENVGIFEEGTFITTGQYFGQILSEVKNRKKYYNQRYFILEGINANKYLAKELQEKLDELRKEGFAADYTCINDNKIEFLFINESDENNQRQLKILKNILKEEKLYEI